MSVSKTTHIRGILAIGLLALTACRPSPHGTVPSAAAPDGSTASDVPAAPPCGSSPPRIDCDPLVHPKGRHPRPPVVAEDTAARRLYQRITELERRIDETADDAEIDRLYHHFVDEMAYDTTIPDDVLRDEAASRHRMVTSLHEGSERVYPDSRTLHWMLGISSALDHALERRGIR